MAYEFEKVLFNGKIENIDLCINGITPFYDIHGNSDFKKKELPIDFIEKFDYLCLRDIQIGYCKSILNGNLNGIVNLSTGIGKTMISVVIMYNLYHNGYKNLVIVDKKNIRDQWLDTFEKLKIWIHGNRGEEIEYSIFDILIINTAIKKTLNYDCMIVDECHTVTSMKRYNWFINNQFNFVIGLSATIENNREILNCIFGKVLVSNIDTLKKQSTLLNIYRYDNYDDYTTPMKNIFDYIDRVSKPRVNYTQLLSDICNNSTRNLFIASIINEMDLTNRKLLLISDRISQLNEIQKYLNHTSFIVVSKSVKNSEYMRTKECKVILGISNIVKQGFDVPDLDTLLFACPKKNVIQSIGRIYRKHHENTPVIIDILDNIPFLKFQFYNHRLKQYKASIENLEINNM